MARRNKGEEREVAKQRVLRLVTLAEAATRSGLKARADRYADLGWRLKTTYQIRGSAIDARICRACHAFLHPGTTARVRIRAGRRSTTCLACGHVRRKVLSPKGLSRGQASPAS